MLFAGWIDAHTMEAERFGRLIERIDRLNSADPNVENIGGSVRSREVVYSQQLTRWVLKLSPQATEPLRIAARGQHVRRWTIPRSRYPMDRRGYLRWREALKAMHIETVAELMRDEGYPREMIDRVRIIMSKRRIADDAESQTLEDALCLVFLETQLAELRRKTSDEKMKGIIQKTWQKMSAQARSEALKLPLPEEEQHYLRRALETGE